jgi:hypothetical protein
MDISAGRVLSLSLKGTTKTDHPMMTLEGPMECEVTVTPVK